MNLSGLVVSFFSSISKCLTVIYNLFKGLLAEWKCHCVPQAISGSLGGLWQQWMPLTKVCFSACPKHLGPLQLGPEIPQRLMWKHSFLLEQ